MKVFRDEKRTESIDFKRVAQHFRADFGQLLLRAEVRAVKHTRHVNDEPQLAGLTRDSLCGPCNRFLVSDVELEHTEPFRFPKTSRSSSPF